MEKQRVNIVKNANKMESKKKNHRICEEYTKEQSTFKQELKD
jgi:hypothetical protein